MRVICLPRDTGIIGLRDPQLPVNQEKHMIANDIDLLASYWTIAGDTYPGAPSEVSPFPLRERVEISAAAGWRGLGFVHADIIAQIEKLGMREVKSIFADNNVRHLELEFLVDWH